MDKFDFKRTVIDFVKHHTGISNIAEDKFETIDKRLKLIKREQKQSERLRWRNFKW